MLFTYFKGPGTYYLYRPMLSPRNVGLSRWRFLGCLKGSLGGTFKAPKLCMNRFPVAFRVLDLGMLGLRKPHIPESICPTFPILPSIFPVYSPVSDSEQSTPYNQDPERGNETSRMTLSNFYFRNSGTLLAG